MFTCALACRLGPGALRLGSLGFETTAEPGKHGPIRIEARGTDELGNLAAVSLSGVETHDDAGAVEFGTIPSCTVIRDQW